MLTQRAEDEQRHGDAEVGRVHEVAHPAGDRRLQDVLLAHRDHHSEQDRPELVVGVEQHVDGKSGDVRRQQELVHAPRPAAEETRLCWYAQEWMSSKTISVVYAASTANSGHS